MAKKRKAIDLSSQNIQYLQDNITYKVLRFHPSYMTVHVKKIEDNQTKDVIDMPFAHLPKEIKKIIKPN